MRQPASGRAGYGRHRRAVWRLVSPLATPRISMRCGPAQGASRCDGEWHRGDGQGRHGPKSAISCAFKPEIVRKRLITTDSAPPGGARCHRRRYRHAPGRRHRPGLPAAAAGSIEQWDWPGQALHHPERFQVFIMALGQAMHAAMPCTGLAALAGLMTALARYYCTQPPQGTVQELRGFDRRPSSLACGLCPVPKS